MVKLTKRAALASITEVINRLPADAAIEVHQAPAPPKPGTAASFRLEFTTLEPADLKTAAPRRKRRGPAAGKKETPDADIQG